MIDFSEIETEQVLIPDILDKAKITQLLNEDYSKLSPNGTALNLNDWEKEFDFEKVNYLSKRTNSSKAANSISFSIAALSAPSSNIRSSKMASAFRVNIPEEPPKSPVKVC